MRERYFERDYRLKQFATSMQNGGNPSVDLQEDFLKFSGQIASRKALRMSVTGLGLGEIVDEVRFRVVVAIMTGEYVPTDSPAAGYISTVTRNIIINGSAKQRARENWLLKNSNYSKERKVRPTRR